ncbi:FAD-dependent oxidoreductase [Streptomyces coeruleorubidus]|uniref:FAD-dependent oxidoreductase n=1 Tax=Streptomyces coeruleorubidus TaxID=116188 RepID=UPI00237FB37B|nr:FAD-dependent oxidoreductase [Streptomyces coeruleorubidus]WDV53026.1 FAD-dependent oxidoreductase [Streptomyces coeruleorubidus]
MSRKAIIVGGGIGGLATAVHLRAGGWDVEVHERAPAPPGTGTGTSVGLWPAALRALDELGVGGLPGSGPDRRPGAPSSGPTAASSGTWTSRACAAAPATACT